MASLLRKILCRKTLNSKNKDRVYTGAEFAETFEIPKKALSFVFSRMMHDLSEIRAKCWRFLYWLGLVNITPGFLMEIIGIAETLMKANSFMNAVEVFTMLPCLGIGITGMMKSMKIYCNRSTFENLYRELNEMWPTGEVTEAEHRIITAALKQLNFVIKGYYLCNIAFLISYLSPSVWRYVLWCLGYDVPINFLFKYWVPFDISKPVISDIILAHQAWAGVTVLWSNVSWDMLFCVFIAHITMQFELLSPQVRNLVQVPVDRQLVETYPLAKVIKECIEDDTGIPSSSYHYHDLEIRQQTNLDNIIKKHRTLIRLAETVEEMSSFALLINIINSSIIICFCGFCCILIEKWNEFAYKSFFVSALSQTWLLCWHGQKLLASNDSLSQALYECGWYNSTKRIKGAILIMLVRAQKGVQVTSYGFSTISLSTYSAIIKTSWSYFTLLLKFYSGSEDKQS